MKSRRKLVRSTEDDEYASGRDKQQDLSPVPQRTKFEKETLPAKGYRIHLRNCSDIRRLLSSNINRVRQGTMSPAAANSCAYQANIMLKCFELMEFAAQLRVLERKVFGDDGPDLVDLLEEQNKQVEEEDAEYDELD